MQTNRGGKRERTGLTGIKRGYEAAEWESILRARKKSIQGVSEDGKG